MNKFIAVILVLFSLPVFAIESILEASAGKTTLFANKEPYPVAGLYGTLIIKSHENSASHPTRFVIGLFDENPNKYSFQVVLERIKDTDEYWLAYEYIKGSELLLRIDIQSGIKQEQQIPFNFFYHKGGRLQISMFETVHFPVTNMKSKAPFFKATSGKAVLNYEYREAYWKEDVPTEAN